MARWGFLLYAGLEWWDGHEGVGVRKRGKGKKGGEGLTGPRI